MNQRILIGILALQVILVAAAFLNRLREPEVPEVFLDVQFDTVTSISISSDEDTIELEKVDDQWLLGDGNPADGDKVDRVFTEFTTVKGGWPVATSISSATRFEVADDVFQKHVVLTSEDDVVADVYVGTSPGYRNVHARVAGSNSVYSIPFSSYELSTNVSGWLDKKLLAADGHLTKLARGSAFTLMKSDDAWIAEPNVELDVDEVEKFIGRFTDLSVYDVSDADISEIEPIDFNLTDASGEYSLQLFHDEDNDDWIASSSKVHGTFSVSSYIAKQMTVALEELAIEPDEEVDPVEGEIQDAPAEDEGALLAD